MPDSAPDSARSAIATPESSPREARGSERRGKILIVDDTPANLTAFSAMLSDLNATIVTASSGEEALRKVLREEFALILLDVRMPELDGYETARLIHMRDRSRQVPIIFLTAMQSDEKFIARGYSVGAVDFILKPVDANILLSKVEVFLELHEKGLIIREQGEQLRRAAEQKLLDYQRWSEERYASLADAVPELVWTADGSGTLVYRNRRWVECAGRDVPQLDFADVLHPDDLAAFLAGWRSALAERRPWEAELRFGSTLHGQFRWHLVRVMPTFTPDGAIGGWLGTGTDIDTQKRTQQALEMLVELTRRLSELTEGAPGLEEVLALALPVLGDAVLLDLSSLSGPNRRLGTALPAVVMPALDDPRLGMEGPGAKLSAETEVLLDVQREISSGASGEHTKFLSELGIVGYIRVPLAARGRVLGTLAFFTSASGRRYLESDVRLASEVARRLATALENLQLYEIAERERKKLEEASRAKDVFLATLSHELRTPLNAIVGWGHLLQNGNLDADRSARAVETIDRNARSLAKLVGDLIDVSRIVSGNLKVEEKRVDLAQIVESAVDAARPAAEAAGLTLELELEPQSHDMLGDPTRLQQIVGNVIANALKFTPKGGRIRVRLSSRDDRAVLSVTDTGHGIASEFLPFVFEPFRQGRRTHARSQDGLGLGLAIVKRLVELHGGAVRAESDGPGCGATLVIELPLSDSQSNDGQRISTDDSPSGTRTSWGGQLLAGVHALIVEDDPDGCELLETLLRGFGATVSTAATANDAYISLRQRRPDVIVSDIGLPDEDGLSLIRRIRETEGMSELPALALTAYASKRDVAEALAAGFHAHVAKPVEPHELGKAIAQLSGRRVRATGS